MQRTTPIVLEYILFFLLLYIQANGQKTNEYSQVISKFEQWKALQYKKGNFEPGQRCNFDTVAKEGYKGPGMGIPKDINIYFTDINGDDKLDALVTFHPDQCDGGNALMNTQIRVLILSKATGYTANDKYVDEVESKLKKGWLNIESASSGTLYGHYYEYRNSDGRCCPGIKRPVEIDFKTKKLTYIE